MENEWMTCLPPILRRICLTRSYCFQLLLALMTGLIGVPLLWRIRASLSSLPTSAVQLFWNGSSYQLGFLALSDWQAGTDGYCDEIIRGVFSGTLVSVSAVLHVARFFSGEYRGAYLQLWLMRGKSRKSLFLLYELGIMVSILPVLLLFQAGTWCSLGAIGVTALQSGRMVIAILLVQMLMLVCLCFCSAAIAINLRDSGGVLILTGAVLSAPALSSYLFLLTKGTRFSKGVLLLTRLMYSSALTAGEIPEALAVSVLITAFCGTSGYIMFCRKYIE